MLLTMKLIADNGVNIREIYLLNVFSYNEIINIKTQYGKLNGKLLDKIHYRNDTNSALKKIRKLLVLQKWKGENTGTPYTLAELSGDWIDAGLMKRSLIWEEFGWATK